MTNRDLAEKIYEDLNKKGADLGNASIGIIRKTLDDNGVKNCSIPDVSPSLLSDAKDFLLAIETWNGREMKDGMNGHKLVKMRPILLAKKVCRTICNEG